MHGIYWVFSKKQCSKFLCSVHCSQLRFVFYLFLSTKSSTVEICSTYAIGHSFKCRWVNSFFRIFVVININAYNFTGVFSLWWHEIEIGLIEIGLCNARIVVVMAVATAVAAASVSTATILRVVGVTVGRLWLSLMVVLVVLLLWLGRLTWQRIRSIGIIRTGHCFAILIIIVSISVRIPISIWMPCLVLCSGGGGSMMTAVLVVLWFQWYMGQR